MRARGRFVVTILSIHRARDCARFGGDEKTVHVAWFAASWQSAPLQSGLGQLPSLAEPSNFVPRRLVYSLPPGARAIGHSARGARSARSATRRVNKRKEKEGERERWTGSTPRGERPSPRSPPDPASRFPFSAPSAFGFFARAAINRLRRHRRRSAWFPSPAMPSSRRSGVEMPDPPPSRVFGGPSTAFPNAILTTFPPALFP